MIGYLEGKLLKIEEDRILLLAGPVGYEIVLPAMVMERVRAHGIGDSLALHIYYHQTERQPKPTLIGFTDEVEKEFFQLFLSVEAIGPLKAAKALDVPIGELAQAIEARDAKGLTRLKGIGFRTAQKIIATLEGRVSRFTLDQAPERALSASAARLEADVLQVLVDQLGYKRAEAQRLVGKALGVNAAVATPEELLDEIFRLPAGS
ncbi:MAG: Holliday junction branch migration protein RuvA [Desulfobacterales bacterium]